MKLVEMYTRAEWLFWLDRNCQEAGDQKEKNQRICPIVERREKLGLK